jgi:hypothetical protein
MFGLLLRGRPARSVAREKSREEEPPLKPIVIEVRGKIPAPIENVFDVFMPIDLTTIMHGYGPLPAVSAIEDQTGAWDSIGESRIVRLADGHAMLETVTGVDRPRGFTYTLSNLTNILRFFVHRFHGSWAFEEVSAPTESPVVRAIWRYEFDVRSRFTRPISWLILTFFWRPYMEGALKRASEQATQASTGGPE